MYSDSETPASCAFFCIASLVAYETLVLTSSVHFPNISIASIYYLSLSFNCLSYVYVSGFCCCYLSANSGQCNSHSSHKSFLDTAPFVAFSIAVIRSNGIGLTPVIHWFTVGPETPRHLAKAICPPRIEHAFFKCRLVGFFFIHILLGLAYHMSIGIA